MPSDELKGAAPDHMHENQLELFDEPPFLDEPPLTAGERSRIGALCWCGHGPAAHPQVDARCDVPTCRCTAYSRLLSSPPTGRTTL